jgi:thymidylate synthase
MLTIDNIRQEFKDLLAAGTTVEDKTGVKVLEITPAWFLADQPAIFGTVNEDYVRRELAWYDSQSLNVKDIPGGAPEIWRQVADDMGRINSNYGWCIYSQENWRQYYSVLKELRTQPTSRRAVMIYTRPSMWHDYNKLGRSDFMCTNAVQYTIRNNLLHAHIQMRSNDAVFGYKNDYAWQAEVLRRLAADLEIETGNIYWCASSLHIYERHWNLIT